MLVLSCCSSICFYGEQQKILLLLSSKTHLTYFFLSLSLKEAKALPGVGKRLAEKIWEIAESGELRKLNEFKSSEEIRVIEMFKDVWGAGATTARTWYQQVNDAKRVNGKNGDGRKIALLIQLFFYYKCIYRMQKAATMAKLLRMLIFSTLNYLSSHRCGFEPILGHM